MKIFVALSAFVLFLPYTAAAAPLAQCAGAECNFCHLIQMLDVISDWLIAVGMLVAVLLFMYAGAKLVLAKGDVPTVTKAKEIITNVVVGLLIMIVAWTVVDLILKSITGGDYGVWNKPAKCGGAEPVTKNELKKTQLNVNTEKPGIPAVVPTSGPQ